MKRRTPEDVIRDFTADREWAILDETAYDRTEEAFRSFLNDLIGCYETNILPNAYYVAKEYTKVLQAGPMGRGGTRVRKAPDEVEFHCTHERKPPYDVEKAKADAEKRGMRYLGHCALEYWPDGPY